MSFSDVGHCVHERIPAFALVLGQPAMLGEKREESILSPGTVT